MLLEIKKLVASTGEKKSILNGIELKVKPGEVHAIMGPNGSGKSTLANILAGNPAYQITQGKILYQDQDITALSADERALAGLFLAFQYPVEIPGVSNVQFLKAAMNCRRKAQGLSELDAMEFLKLVKDKLQSLGMDQDLLYRPINEGFSGGEKKRNEMLQMSLFEPKLCILDETDSGLDIDALKIVAKTVNQMRTANRSFILITHYQRLLNYIEPDVVHVLYRGKIIKEGDKSLVTELEEKGYGFLTDPIEEA